MRAININCNKYKKWLPKIIKYRSIIDINLNVLEHWLSGKSVEDTASKIGIPSQSVHRIAHRTIMQQAINLAYDNGQDVDVDMLIDEAKLKRREIRYPHLLAAKKLPKYMRKKEIPTRSISILKSWEKKETLEHIAKKYGITRGRVRQVIKSTAIQQARNLSYDEGVEINAEHFLKEINRNRNELVKKKIAPKLKKTKWSRHYNACRKCAGISYPHYRYGNCEKCAGCIRGERREQIITAHNSRCEKCNIIRGEAKVKYKRDLYITKSLSVLCQGCFRRHATFWKS